MDEMNDSVDRTTDYGFTWGPMKVERVAEYCGTRALSVEVPGQPRIEILVSPKGRSIRVFRGEDELT